MGTKPAKPHRDFPLTANGNGQWSKKVKGKVHYFGVWADPQAALERYLEQKDYLFAGQIPPATGETLADVCNSFLKRQQRRAKDGEIEERTFWEYKYVTDVIVSFGKNMPVKFFDLGQLRSKLGMGKNGKRLSPNSHKRWLTIARMVFHHANERMGIQVRYKDDLSPPPARLLRLNKKVRLYEPEEIRAIMDEAEGDLLGMIYLGINCGFGADDCCRLPVEEVDLANQFHTYGRNKTGMTRRCPLWGDTCSALDCFQGYHDWNRWKISKAFNDICNTAGVESQGHYTLRRTFETVATTAPVNQAVIDYIMGHTPKTGDMGAVYRQKIYDDSLRACTDHVQGWLRGSIELA